MSPGSTVDTKEVDGMNGQKINIHACVENVNSANEDEDQTTTTTTINASGTVISDGLDYEDPSIVKVKGGESDQKNRYPYYIYELHKGVKNYEGQQPLNNGGIITGLDQDGCKERDLNNALRDCWRRSDCKGVSVSNASDNSTTQKVCYSKDIDKFSKPTFMETPTDGSEPTGGLFVQKWRTSNITTNEPDNNMNDFFRVYSRTPNTGGVKGFKGQEKYVGIDGAGASGCEQATVNAAIVKCRGDENCHGFTSKAGLNRTATNEVCYKQI